MYLLETVSTKSSTKYVLSTQFSAINRTKYPSTILALVDQWQFDYCKLPPRGMSYGKKKQSKYSKKKSRATRTWKKSAKAGKGHGHLFTFSLDTSRTAPVYVTGMPSNFEYATHWHDAPPTGGTGTAPYILPCPTWQALSGQDVLAYPTIKGCIDIIELCNSIPAW